MKFTNLGKTGITVSRICLGCMSYGGGEMPAWAQGTAGSRRLARTTTLTTAREQLHHQHQDQVRNYVIAPLGK